MEIEVTQEKLSKALNNVSRIAVGKVTLPVLNNVLIRVLNKKVSLITTNLDMAIVDFLPVSSSKDGVITVPAKLLAEFVSNLPKGERIKITEKDHKITISAGKYKSIINGSPADDFPELPEINEKNAVVFKMGVDEFKTGISEVAIASSNDLTRPAFTGIYFNTYDKTLAIAATDGYRLAEKKLIKNVQSEIAVIVPIPKNNNIKLELNREELNRVTKLAALFARSVNGSIVCEAKKPNIFSIKSVASELGENDSTIETKVEEEGKVTLNSRFLMDALNSLEEPDLIIEFNNKITPVLLRNKKNNDYIHIVMPLNS